MRQGMRTLKAARLGFIRLDLSAVDQIIQVGDNIDFDKPAYFIVIGKAKQDKDAQRVYLISINYEGVLRVVDNHRLPETFAGADPRSIFASRPSSKHNDANWRLVSQEK